MTDSPPPFVIDLGSGFCKAGFGGEAAPCHVFPSILCRNQSVSRMEDKEAWVGTEAIIQMDASNVEYPVKRGVVDNWNAWEKFLDCTFADVFDSSPDGHLVMLTESPLPRKPERERKTSILFETFNVGRFYLAKQPVLTLYDSGRVTGVVVQLGDGVTHSVPCYEGYVLPHSVLRMDLAGQDIDRYLLKILCERDFSIKGADEIQKMEALRKMKESVCYVAQDYEKELTEAQETPQSVEFRCESVELLDGERIDISTTVGSERFRAPEILFKPSFIGKEYSGVHEMVFNSMHKSDVDIRLDFYRNIILGGGSTMFRGFAERLQTDVRGLIRNPRRSEIRVRGLPDAQFSSWRGGSTLTSLATFEPQWITRAEYDDEGERVVHRKCF